MVISTTEESKKLQRKMMEKKEKKRKIEVDRRGEIILCINLKNLLIIEYRPIMI